MLIATFVLLMASVDYVYPTYIKEPRGAEQNGAIWCDETIIALARPVSTMRHPHTGASTNRMWSLCPLRAHTKPVTTYLKYSTQGDHKGALSTRGTCNR